MSGLALIAAALGAEVSGSDRAPSSYTERLVEHGIEPVFGHAAANVPAGAEVVYSTAIPSDNPERLAAGAQSCTAPTCWPRSRRCAAAWPSPAPTARRRRRRMAVQALQGAGLDPAYVVGGELRSTRATPAGARGSGSWSRPTSQTARCSSSSPRSPCSPTPSSTITPPTARGWTWRRRFAEFMARAGERAVVWDRPELRALCPGGGVPYDAAGARLDPEGSRFDWRGIEVRLSVPGAHNAVNAAGALTACALAGADPAAAAAALADFRGARRRMERVGETAAGAAGLRRLRPPSHRGGRRDRRGAHARAPPAGGRVPAPPLLAHARARAGVRRRPGRRRRGRGAAASIRPASAPRTSRG